MNELSKICATCGTKYPNDYKKDNCIICEDKRQYVPLDGQKWTNSKTLLSNHKVEIKQLKPHLYEFLIKPTFGIGQRAIFVESDQGNILWDCIPLLDNEVQNFISEKGGLKGIAISHPHYYSNMKEWSKKFNCPIYLPETEKDFVVNGTNKIHYWSGEGIKLWDGIELIRIGGHFKGSSILRIPTLSEKGTILCGDTFYLSMSLKHFSVMYSYPNRIPLPIAEVERIRDKVKEINFDEIYGFWNYQHLKGNPKQLLLKSLDIYK